MQVRLIKRAALKDRIYQPGEVANVPDDVGRRWGRRGLAVEVAYVPPAAQGTDDGLDFERLTVAQLRAEAADVGIDSRGMNKKALIAALTEAYEQAKGEESSEDSEEDSAEEGDETEGEESSEDSESEDE